MIPRYDYADCVENSEKVTWRLDDVMPKEATLDFSRPFLPSRLAPTYLDFLSEDERRALNQIAANAYLNLFQFVEEYILATIMEHAAAEVFGNPDQLRALTRFVDEEIKHQQLFKRFRQRFDSGFGIAAGVLENAAEVAGVIMGHSNLAVMLITLHIEWMTQEHYTACAQDDDAIDPFFQSLLHHHCLEEAQHAKIDTLEALSIVEVTDTAGRETAVDEYFGILEAVDGLLQAQVELDVTSFEAKCRAITSEERAAMTALQLRGYRHTFIWYGVSHPRVVEFITECVPSRAAALESQANRWAA